jgi:hypothetical protein
VRIRAVPETERLGYAGRVGEVLGDTVPSEGHIEAETLIGEPIEDVALGVFLEDTEEVVWIAPHLVERIDRGRRRTRWRAHTDDLGEQ